MRDPNRIDPFMEKLAKIWKESCPSWRFGQLMSNAARVMQTHGTDIFYMEDDDLIAYFEDWFAEKDTVEERMERRRRFYADMEKQRKELEEK